MRLLSSPRLLARLVLAWFAAAVFAASAAPVLKPGSFELVCGAHGAVKLVSLATGEASELRNTLDCPLCGSLLAGPVTGERDELAISPVIAPVATGQPRVSGFDTLLLPPARGPPETLLLSIS